MGNLEYWACQKQAVRVSQALPYKVRVTSLVIKFQFQMFFRQELIIAIRRYLVCFQNHLFLMGYFFK